MFLSLEQTRQRHLERDSQRVQVCCTAPRNQVPLLLHRALSLACYLSVTHCSRAQTVLWSSQGLGAARGETRGQEEPKSDHPRAQCNP